jgi:flagellar hook-length control protein FliK
MATITSVLTQDGQPVGSPAHEAVAGEGSGAFPALLLRETGATAATPGALARPENAPPRDEDPAAGLADDLLALVAADLRDTALAVPAVSPGRTPSAGIVPTTDRTPAGGLPIAIAPDRGNAPESPRGVEIVPLDQAVAVLQQERPPERVVGLPADPASVTVPAPVAAAPLRAAGSVDATLEMMDPATQAADALAGLASAEASGGMSEREADGAFAGAATQLAQVAALRDGAPHIAHSRTLSGALGTPAWQNSLGTEVRLLIERGASAATLRVSPEHLGPIEVRIDLADERASVWFTAANADTRAALADALPRLRDMLASVGVSLGETGVQREAPGGTDRHDGSPPGGMARPESNAGSRVVLSQFDTGRGLVDEYA